MPRMASTSHLAMSRALFVSEIVSKVISHAKITDTLRAKTESRKSLLALALTCRSFSEQALDALWESLIGIDPVMQCAGIVVPNILTSCEDSEDCRIIPTESQLVTIDRYAHRVRFLKMASHDWQSNIVQSFLQTLAYSLKVLMPNLRRLSCEFSADMLHLLRPLLGPRLQDLIDISHFGCGKRVFSHKTALHVVLRTLYSCCPSLENLRLSTSGGTWDAHTTRAASHSIQRLQKLRTVAVPAITKDALAHLGRLSCLTSLYTHLPTGSDLEDVFRSSRTPLPFKNLQSVNWDITDWADIEVFTRLWPPSHELIRLSLRFRSKVHFDPGLLHILFESLYAREAFKHLQSIYITQPSGYQTIPAMIITINTIRPLFHLSHLRVVGFDMRFSIWVDNDDLKRMAKAWPSLEEFYLNKSYGCHNPAPGVTLLGLVEFIELCPHLTALCIGSITLAGVDMDSDEDFHLDSVEPCRSSTLEYLSLAYPNAQERHDDIMWGERLRDFLETLFPSPYLFFISEA
ncbi:hypothetical protein EDB19DRAFT_1945947 [Suillus lakei]|nr:hypothetical protein EDB19DRAFT_1945947 [Suillus lakei]